MERKEKFLATVAPKWGDEAAEYNWTIFRLRWFALPGGWGAFWVLWTLAQSGHATLALGISLVIFCLVVPTAIVALASRRKMFQAATRTLGVPVNRRSSPPSNARAYEAWCRRNGLTPYTASKRFRQPIRSSRRVRRPPVVLPPDVAAQVATDEQQDDRPWWWAENSPPG